MKLKTGEQYRNLNKLITEGNKIIQNFTFCKVALRMCINCRSYVRHKNFINTAWDGVEIDSDDIFYCKLGGFEIKDIGTCDEYKRRGWRERKIVIR